MLSQVQRLFANGDIQYKNNTLPIVRVDHSKYTELLEEKESIFIDGVPRIYIFIENSYYLYTEGDHLNYFLLYLNKLLHPIVELKTNLEVQLFINPKVEWIESTPFYAKKYRTIDDLYTEFQIVTRAIAFVYDTEKYAEKIKQLETAARDLAGRSDLRVALVTNKDLIQKYKNEYYEKWFATKSKNTIVLIQNDKNLNLPQTFYNLDEDEHEFKAWLNFVSLDDIERFSPQAYQIVSYIDMPIFLAFFKKNFTQDDESFRLFKILKKIAYKYPPLMMMFTDDEVYYHLREQIHIQWEEMPAIGLLNNEGMLPVIFPKDQKMSEANLDAFFSAFLNGTIFHQEFTFPELEKSFGKYAPTAISINSENFESIVLNEDLDILLHIYNSSQSYFANIESAQMIGFVGQLLDDIKADTVKVAYLDVEEYFDEIVHHKDQKYPYLIFMKSGSRKQQVVDYNIPVIIDHIRANAGTDIVKAFQQFDENIRQIQQNIKDSEGEKSEQIEDL